MVTIEVTEEEFEALEQRRRNKEELDCEFLGNAIGVFRNGNSMIRKIDGASEGYANVAKGIRCLQDLLKRKIEAAGFDMTPNYLNALKAD